jgi:leucyl-tRNA synthetase
MYSRFVTKVLHDLGFLTFDEPFPKFYAHGLMIKDGAKMSKSRGNVVNPDEYVAKFGADTLRLYEMFLGPMDAYPDFRDSGIEGMEKFVARLWKIFSKTTNTDQPLSSEVTTKLHKTIKKVTEDMYNFKYNTAIAAIMELTNVISSKGADKETLKTLCLLIAPFAPHLAEEVWVEVLGEPFSVHKAEWPKYDDSKILSDTVNITIQINGKMRDILNIEAGVSNDEEKVTEMATDNEKITKWLDGKTIKKTVFVPGKLINFVV